MAIETINLGTNPNDGTGDNFRTAFGKVNDNFAFTANASNLGSGTLADARLSARVQSASSRPATVYVDAANGSDTAGNLRGTSAAYASFAAALVASQANDTIYVRGGSSPALTGTINFVKDMTIRGDGRFQSVFAVDNTTSVQFAPGVAVSILDLGFAGAGPATTSNGILLQLNQSKGVEVSRCAFTNLNQFAIGGYSVYRTRIRDNYISHCGGGILIDDLSAAQLATGNYNFSNVDLTIEDNHIEWTVANGIVLHNINAYNAEDAADAHIGSAKFATNLRLIGNTVRYASMGLQTGGPQLAYEVWHGWSNGLIADNLAEDSYFGYSFDRVNNSCIANNRSVHCSFLYEFNTCTDLSLDSNMADARPSAGSPFTALGLQGTVVFDGGTMNCHWRGGVLTATSIQFGFDPVQHCSVTGASFSSSYVFVQHATDIAVTDNFFAPTPGAPAAGSWLIIDMGGEAIGPVTFSRNTIRGGANGYGITVLNPGTISCLTLEDNVSDGTYTASGCCPNAQLHAIALSHVWKGNRGFPNDNNPLPNDDDAITPSYVEQTYVEQTWDGTANVTVAPTTTVLRLINGTPGTQHTITLPTAPANGQTLEIVVPPSTGTPASDPVTGGAVQFKVTPANLSIPLDPTYTRVYRLIAGTGGWAIDQSLVRQNTSASFSGVTAARADFSGDVVFETGTTIHGTEGTEFGFAVLCINGEPAQFTPVTLAPGQSARLNAAGTALEAYTASGGGLLAFNDVEDNPSKLALPASTPPGYPVRITGEGDRLEVFVGGDITQDANWGVLRNTVNLTINPGGSTATYNSVVLDGSTVVNVGWVDPTNIPVENADDGIFTIEYPGVTMNLFQNGSQAQFDVSYGPLSLPIPVPPRASVTIVLNGGDGG